MALFAKGIKDNTDVIANQLEKSFDFEDIISKNNFDVNTVSLNKYNEGTEIVGNGGFTQNLTINAPEQLNPSEIARQTRNANKEFMLQLRMA